MSHTPATLLSVLTMPGDERLWNAGDGAFRIVMHPHLGWPMTPFAVAFSRDEPARTSIEWRLVGPGAVGNDRVDGGEAWLVLTPTSSQPDPDPGYLVLELDSGEPEVALVRHIGDARLGLVTRSWAPYTFAAPAISVLRIRGECTIRGVFADSGHLQHEWTDARQLALPFPASLPQYHGLDDAQALARERVRAGAPARSGPHEVELTNDPADAEEQRVSALVEPWVTPTAESLISRSLDDRFLAKKLDYLAGKPTPTKGTLDDHAGLLLAATDLGIARWLGLADQVERDGSSTLLMTVAAMWVLPTDHRLASIAPNVADPALIRGFLDQVLGADVVSAVENLADVTLVSAWTHAWIDFDSIPDLPPPPTVHPSPPIWIGGSTPAEDAAAVVGIETRRTALFGSLGVIPDATSPAVHTEFEGAPDRLRPLLAHEGSAFATRFDAPYPPQSFAVFQSDAFGRWSETAAELHVPSPTRPALPAPEPIVSRTHDAPIGDQPWAARLHVVVPIPARAPGQPSVTGVTVDAGGAPVAISIEGQERVTCEVSGLLFSPGDIGEAAVRVVFTGEPTSSSETTRTVTIVDPRPPTPPTPPPVLRFASRADATGVSVASVPLPRGSNIVGYFVDVALEHDLINAAGAPSPGLGRDARAQFWLGRPRGPIDRAFRRTVPNSVPIDAGTYDHELPGDLADLIAFRLVPVGRNGASPDPALCPLVLVAVPLAIVPPPPVLTVDRSIDPPLLVTSSRPGGTPVVEHRVRMLDVAGSDPRLGRVVAAGAIADGEATSPVPTLAPYTRVVFVAEVRGAEEVGQPPLPGRWSQPSDEQPYVAVPAGPPDFVRSAVRSGTGVYLGIDHERAPRSLSDHRALIYCEDPTTGAFVVWRGPVELSERLDDGGPLPIEDLAVVIVDPDDRHSAPIGVEGDPEPPPVPPPPPVITEIDPNIGGPGDTFTIYGTDLVLPGGSTFVMFEIPTDPDQPPNPGSFLFDGTPTPSAIVAIVPEMTEGGRFPIYLARSDGAETTSETYFIVSLL